MTVLFDTNAYRNFAANLQENELDEIVSKMLAYERKRSYSNCFSVVVAMELISHLNNPDDINYIDCYKSLYILARHIENY